MSDFFREVDEEVRRDKAVQFWTKYRYWFLALGLVIVAVTAAWRYWDTRRVTAAADAGSRYEAADQMAREGKAQEAQDAFAALAKDGPKGYATLAKLRSADELATRDPQAAAKAYDALASDPGFDPAFQDLARLRSAMLRIDVEDPKVIEQQLAPMAGPGGAYRNSARELLALAAFKLNDFEAAGRWLDAIVTDPQAPPGARRRAEAFLGLVRAGKLPTN